jgi:hypothetical protein
MAPNLRSSSNAESKPFVNGGLLGGRHEKVRVERVEVPVTLRQEVVKEVRVPHVVETVRVEKVKTPVLDQATAKGIEKALGNIRDDLRGIVLPDASWTSKAPTGSRGFNPAWLAVGAVAVDLTVRIFT